MKKQLHKISLIFLWTLIATTVSAQQGEWTWMKGSSGANDLGTYGTQGVSDPANNPASAFKAAEWTDKDGNFWLFGGTNSNYGEMNAMWKYDPSTDEWTWMRGSSICCQAGVYGTQGIPSTNNMPGARGENCYTWVDTTGDLWLFGGIGRDVNGGYQVLSDLWRYHIATDEWTWMDGPNAETVPPVYGTQGVPDDLNDPGARAYANATWVDDSNRLWLFGGLLYDPFPGGWGFVGCGADIWMWNPNTVQWTWMQGTSTLSASGVYGTKGVAAPANHPPGKGCYTHFKDAEGNFYMFGGFNLGQAFNDLWKYDWHTNEFTWVSGPNTTDDIGNYGTQCTPSVDNIPPSRYENRWCWSDGCDNFWLFGGVGNTNGGYNDLWHYNVQTNEWTWSSGSSTSNQTSVYGTQGISDPANHQSARYGGVSWRDNDGNLWTWGGAEIDFNTLAKNDLWRFVIDPACPILATCAQQIAALSVSDSALCEKFCVDFTDMSTNNPVAWHWTFEGASPSSSTSQNPTNICYNGAGTYDVTLVATDANGDSLTTTLTDFITVYANPFAPVITQNANILTSSTATSYQWYLNEVLIPGATDQSYEMTESGLYTVKVSNENDCNSESSIQAYMVGIENVNGDFAVNVFSNPTSGEIVVSGNIPSSEEMQIQLFNSLGQLMMERNENLASDFKLTLDVNELPSGIYFLDFNSSKHHAVRKIILAD